MTPLLLTLILCAALLHATWNALVKSGGDPLLRLAITNAAAGLFVLPLLPFVGLPAGASWPYLAGSVGVHLAYYGFLAASYRVGDLSFAYPVARGVAPPLVAIAAFAFAGERLSAFGILAVALICLAIFAMAMTGRRDHGSPASRNSTSVLVLALGTGVCISSYTILDGLGARLSANVPAYIAWMFALDALPLAVLMLYRRRCTLGSHLRSHWQAGLASGLCALCAYGLVIWAMTRAPLAYVSALRETSVILAAIIGCRLLREPFGGHRVAAAGLVAFGVILLEFSKA